MSADMRRELNELKKAVEGTNAAVAQLAGVIGRLDQKFEAKSDADDARFDANDARFDSLSGKLDRTMVTVVNLAGDFADLKSYLAENMATKKDISLLNDRMDGFSGLLLDSRHRWAAQAETLSRHEERLTKLEAPKS